MKVFLFDHKLISLLDISFFGAVVFVYSQYSKTGIFIEKNGELEGFDMHFRCKVN